MSITLLWIFFEQFSCPDIDAVNVNKRPPPRQTKNKGKRQQLRWRYPCRPTSRTILTSGTGTRPNTTKNNHHHRKKLTIANLTLYAQNFYSISNIWIRDVWEVFLCRVLYSADCRNIILFVHIFTKNSDGQNRCFSKYYTQSNNGSFPSSAFRITLTTTIKIYPQYEHNPEKYQTIRVQTPG